ncbi:unnamed protein product [Brachionus calyciflorus]|uniref:Uncharacterized protein n=1 Tax=Brachionus calyciflorus TaxID=104777 RepID=A0A814R072_9BILA|nr:unnamed protein product [Brachionus calyciflorus]
MFADLLKPTIYCHSCNIVDRITMCTICAKVRHDEHNIDLKINLKLWSNAKQNRIQPGQSDIKIFFRLPIVCSNLMFEYADFCDRNSELTSESAFLQCPRCSASVPAVPGVCMTCGENVFQ